MSVGARHEGGVEDPGAMAGEVQPQPGHDLDGVGIGGLVIEQEAGRGDPGRHPTRREALAEQGLGHGGATDVAGAHDDDVDGPGV